MLSIKFILTSTLVFILMNLLILDIWVWNNKPFPSGQKNQTAILNPLQNTNKNLDINSNPCLSSCSSELNTATSSLKVQPTKVLNNDSNLKNVQVDNNPKEFFITFGSGSSNSSDWVDVPGLLAIIDSNNYGKIKNVHFEAAAHNPYGEQSVYVRLYNVTDKHPVWYSDVSMSGKGPSFIISKSINLDSGNKLYQVQMKTSLKTDAILDQSRIRIITY